MKITDVRARLKAMGRSQADLARHLNDLDPSTLSKMLSGSGREVHAHEVPLIEAYIGEKLEIAGAPEAASFTPRRPVQRRIPVYGYAAAGGGDRIAYADDQVLE